MTTLIDQLAETLGLGPDAQPILDRLQTFYRAIDAELAEKANGLELPCRRGCDACCHESVFLSAPEFLNVAAHLHAHRTPEERAQLVLEMQFIAARFEDELELLETITGAERDEVAARVKFRCPLLGAGGECSIYEARELNARTFGQSWDRARNEAYGCHLTVDRLVQIGEPRAAKQLADARDARKRLTEAVPGTELVHVYPWWFDRFGALLLQKL